MRYGFVLAPTDLSISVTELARALEERSFESLFVPEHSHIPLSRRTPWPGGERPREFWRTMDPIVALTAAASVTERLRIATGVCLVAQRDPLILAKEVASLDRLSGGRLTLGVGAGWNVEEMENHGTDFRTRWSVLEERVRAMKALWTEEAPEFHGRFVRFDPVFSHPKPLQRPHPPLLLGGRGASVLRRIVRDFDGWLPIEGRAEIAESVPEMRRLAEDAGRDPASLSVSVYAAKPDARTIESYARLGVERVVFGLPPKPRDAVLPLVDAITAFVQSLALQDGLSPSATRR